MAAPAAAAEERAMKNPSVGLSDPAEPPGRAGGGFPEDPETQRDDVLDFLKKEVGSDLKSLKNVLTGSSSLPPKVSAALSAAEDAVSSVEDLLQREGLVSNELEQVATDSRGERSSVYPKHP
ncbi:hypothetical protein EYF80_061526 [Liparis tanakae]|uniref:Uncharacterized protein n=1 Tax=Liparis tanakae TaxID=230148 RepID=A0A4Z2EHT7_9TELE|nr:hypothetical protein EYF80_061526 [Liparis tanakae]